jgi:tricorn protease interacting factor F2/3
MPAIEPIDYHIIITPDLERFQFQGTVTVRLSAPTAVKSVRLNVLELAIWDCRLRQKNDWTALAFSVDPEQESLTIALPRPMAGELVLEIRYDGVINDKMAGFYRSRFTRNGQTHDLAVTQFQESSARQAFPCMDHPARKAVFELELIVPEVLTAIANSPVTRCETLDAGRKRVVFAPTPKMSTYLLFFGVGPFEQVQDGEDPRVRVVHLPGLAHTTGLGLAFGRKALRYCEAYYGIAYPLAKMDLIAVPDFAFGAMENWGAITFRENLLLFFADLTSQSGAQRICEVIAHEIAHQWFGNLVTPEDWKYLWLNESFATYFGYGAVAHHHPEWQVWHQFLHGETATALSRDGLNETFAIEIPGGQHVVINASTAPIIYNKGASILRMIEGYIGSENYQRGVRRYLEKHQYACARSHDLWQAFEAVSSQPVTAMMQNWIGQPGHPLISVERRGSTVTLRQERFTYLDNDTGQTWIVPVTLTAWTADGRRHDRALLLSGATGTVDLPEETACYKLNSDQTGFYRCAYADPANLAALGERVRDQSLGVEDRWGLQNDLFALVRKGSIPMRDYLAFLNQYDRETAYLPTASIAGHLLQAMLVAAPGHRPAIVAAGRAMAERRLERIGYDPVATDPLTTAILRDQLLWQAVLWASTPATDFVSAQFETLAGGGTVNADIARAVMQGGAWTMGRPALTWLHRRLAESPSEHERINILAALGSFQEWPLIEEALAFTLEQVPPRNRFMPIVAAAANPVAQPHLWAWYQNHLNTLEQFHPLLYERVITALWPVAGLDRAPEVHRFGNDYMQTHPGLADAIKLALENLEINALMRGRE